MIEENMLQVYREFFQGEYACVVYNFILEASRWTK